MAWKCLTEEFGLDPERLYATYFEGSDDCPCDTEARDLWLKYLPESRVLPFDAKDNFWEMGATGPCGPCTVRAVVTIQPLNVPSSGGCDQSPCMVRGVERLPSVSLILNSLLTCCRNFITIVLATGMRPRSSTQIFLTLLKSGIWCLFNTIVKSMVPCESFLLNTLTREWALNVSQVFYKVLTVIMILMCSCLCSTKSRD